jgi:MOSC domain-containing protein YiiM
MIQTVPPVDSTTLGDPTRFLPLAELEAGLRALPAAPLDLGRVALVLRRGEGGRREILERALLTPEGGVPGDTWGRLRNPNPEAQIAVMELAAARLIANGQPLALFGDCLFLELDLSVENLPVGSRLRAGGAVLEVTPKEHNGCRKFLARFGEGALRFAGKPELRHRNLRGIYLRVVAAGEVGPGDPVAVSSRPS